MRVETLSLRKLCCKQLICNKIFKVIDVIHELQVTTTYLYNSAITYNSIKISHAKHLQCKKEVLPSKVESYLEVNA